VSAVAVIAKVGSLTSHPGQPGPAPADAGSIRIMRAEMRRRAARAPCRGSIGRQLGVPRLHMLTFRFVYVHDRLHI